MKKLKKMKKTTMIILVLLFVFIMTMGIFVYKERDILVPMYCVITNQTNKLEQKKVDTDQEALEAIKDFGITEVRPLSEEESKKLAEGEITEEEAVNIVLGKTEENQENPGETSSDINNLTSEEYKAKNEEIAQHIGKMYVLKAKFSSDLSGIEDWVKDKYWEYTKEFGGTENVPSSVKTKVGKQAYAKALALEDECDKQVNDILARITVLLKETGQSTKVVDEIREAYESEKALAISYYMGQF